MSTRDARDAEYVGQYLIERVRRIAGARWLQGKRVPPLLCTSAPAPSSWPPLSSASSTSSASESASPTERASPAVGLIAENRLFRVGALESRALVLWSLGERRAEILSFVPSAAHIVHLQAQGTRCVSVLEETDGLDFALHDLRHLEKFHHPAHHRAQVGFFRLLDRAIEGAPWASFDHSLDPAWVNDRDRALADMNGCPIFLFSVLKMKLKMAVRRREAGAGPSATTGVLDGREWNAYNDVLEEYLEVLRFPSHVRPYARTVSARRDSPEDAARLLRYFEDCAALRAT